MHIHLKGPILFDAKLEGQKFLCYTQKCNSTYPIKIYTFVYSETWNRFLILMYEKQEEEKDTQ